MTSLFLELSGLTAGVKPVADAPKEVDYMPPKKFLCLCRCGHSRSVALSRIFHKYGIPAVAAGADTAGPDALRVLSQWADRVIVLEEKFAAAVPDVSRPKVFAMDIGPDRWSNPYHPELLALVERLAREAGFIPEKS